MIRALIAGRCRVHLEALAAAVSRSRAVEVLGTASHRVDILARARDDSPDIVLIDATMTDAANIVRDVRQHAKAVKVVVITVGETETEITQLAEAGIARHLGIELATAKNHVHNILEKLHVHRRINASTWYRRGGFHLKLEA